MVVVRAERKSSEIEPAELSIPAAAVHAMLTD
jgi:hypothetical protein